jgi:TPR repeat protein
MNFHKINNRSLVINTATPTSFDKIKFKTEFLDKLKNTSVDNEILIKALKFLHKNSSQGSEQARFQLGVLLIDKNPNLAIRLFIDAYVLQNDTSKLPEDECKINLKTRNELLLDGCKRYPNACSWVLDYFENASQEDSLQAKQAKYQLGVLLKETDPTKAWALFKEAADMGHGEAAFEYAEQSVDPAYVSPRRNIEKAIHDQKQSSSVANFVGKIFSDLVFTSSEDTALYYYQIARKAGITLAEFRRLELFGAQVSTYLITEEFEGTSSEKTEIKLTNPVIAYQVGMTYLDSENKWDVPLDKIKATEYLSCAAQAGYLPAVLEIKMANGDMIAAYTLYQLHLSGNEFLQLPPNKEQAKICLKKAATNGHLDAMIEYAKLYLSPLEQLVAEAFTEQAKDKMDLNKVDTVAEELKKKAFKVTGMESVKPYSSNNTNDSS